MAVGSRINTDDNLVKDFTPRRAAWGFESPQSDRIRTDLSEKLVKIRPMDAVRFAFNDVVDRRSFRAEATTDLPNTLAIVYSDDFEGRLNRQIVQTTWAETRRITGAHQLVWETDRSLLISPPSQGWPVGKFVRFEFDRSLKDDAGNGLIYDRDQVVIARVSADVVCTILRPEQDVTFVPWGGGDDILGRAENFIILVAGAVVQRGAVEHVRSIMVTATSNRGLVVRYKILAGDHERREMRRGKGNGSDWIPDSQFGGAWAVQLTLQSSEWRGEGSQVVVERHDTWTITAEVELATGWVRAANRKVVRFELFQSRVLMILCPQFPVQNGILFHWKFGTAKMRRCVFTRADLGLKQFIIVLDGEFDESMFGWTNSYVGETENHEVLYWERRWSEEVKRWVTWVYLPGFHIHNRINDVVTGGVYRNRMIHKFVFRIRTVGGYVIRFSFPYYVDTLPLDLVDVESVEVDAFWGGRQQPGGGGWTSGSGSSGLLVTGSGGGGVSTSGSGGIISTGGGGGISTGGGVTTIWDDFIRVTDIETSNVEVNFEQTFEGEIDVELSDLFPDFVDPMPGIPDYVFSDSFWDDDSAMIAHQGHTHETGGSFVVSTSTSSRIETSHEWHEADDQNSLIGTAIEIVGTLHHEYSDRGEYSYTAVHTDTGEIWILRGGEFTKLQNGVRVRSGGIVAGGANFDVNSLELEPSLKSPRRKQ